LEIFAVVNNILFMLTLILINLAKGNLLKIQLFCILCSVLIGATGAAFQASKCPNLAGIYDCKGTSGDFNRNGVEIRQTAIADGQKYILPVVGNGQSLSYIRLADGQMRITTENIGHLGNLQVKNLTTCLGEQRLTDSRVVDGYISVQGSYTLQGDKLYVDNLMSSPGGVQRKFRSICKLRH
jgi:hypothetical protein